MNTCSMIPLRRLRFPIFQRMDELKGATVFAVVYGMVILSVSKIGKGEILSCAEEQFAHVNEKGIIGCEVTASFYGVYWYVGNSKDSIIRFINGQKAGPEFQNGRLDIAANGSMIINNVSLSDEMDYRIMVVLSAGGDVSTKVHLTIVVRTKISNPMVDGCDTSQLPCVLCVDNAVTLVCKMDGKPPVKLTWYDAISGETLENQDYSSVSDVSTGTFSSTARVNPPLTIRGQQAQLVCGASGKAVSSTTKNISVVVATPSTMEHVGKTVYFLVNKTLTLNTDINQTSIEGMAWMKQSTVPSSWYSQYRCRYMAGSLGKLNITVFNPTKQDEGIYTFISWTNGTYERNSLLLLEGEPPTITNVSIVETFGQATLDLVVSSRPPAKITWEKNQTNQIKVTSVSSFCSCEGHSCKVHVTIIYSILKTSCTGIIFTLDGPWPKDSFGRFKTVTLCGKEIAILTQTTIPIDTMTSVVYTHDKPNCTTDSTEEEKQGGNYWFFHIFVICLGLVAFLACLIIARLVMNYRRRASQERESPNEDSQREREDVARHLRKKHSENKENTKGVPSGEWGANDSLIQKSRSPAASNSAPEVSTDC